MNPGVQKPHWAPPCRIQDSCRGCKCSGVPMPSIVVTAAPSVNRENLVAQDRTTLPPSITLQAPHWAWLQPTLVPVSPSCSRRIDAREASAGAMIFRATPLTTSSFLIILMFSCTLCGNPFLRQVKNEKSGRWSQPPLKNKSSLKKICGRERRPLGPAGTAFLGTTGKSTLWCRGTIEGEPVRRGVAPA